MDFKLAASIFGGLCGLVQIAICIVAYMRFRERRKPKPELPIEARLYMWARQIETEAFILVNVVPTPNAPASFVAKWREEYALRQEISTQLERAAEMLRDAADRHEQSGIGKLGGTRTERAVCDEY